MTKILKIKIMKIIVMYINVLIMIVRMLKMIVKSDSIENSVCWCFDEASEYKGWVIKLDLTTPVKF
mgnify:CR=1 FL=1|jgi:hypothetical protein